MIKGYQRMTKAYQRHISTPSSNSKTITVSLLVLSSILHSHLPRCPYTRVGRSGREQTLSVRISTGRSFTGCSRRFSFSSKWLDYQRKFRDYTESCCWRSWNQEMWSRRCDTAEMCDMRFWRVGIVQNAVFFHSFVAPPAWKVSS